MMRLAVPHLATAPAPPRGGFVRHLRGSALGTRWSLRLVDPGLDMVALERAIAAMFAEVVMAMSAWEPRSALSRFNAAPADSWHALPSGLRAVLACALDVARESGGAFDPTIAPLVDLWGFGPHPVPPGLPDATLLAAARARCGLGRLGAMAPGGWLRQPGGLALDVCGIGKGYAVDRLAGCAQAAGAASFLAEIGGELRGDGVKPDGMPWWVALESPPGLALPPLRVALHGLAIATSGDYRRYVVLGGRRYAHTLDPRTGWPVAGLAAVTVLDDSCMRADARATALMALGPDAAPRHAARHGIAARFVMRDGDAAIEHLSPAFAAMLD